MIDIKEVHDDILFQLNKPMHGYLSPGKIDIALNRAQRVEFKNLTGNVSEMRPGQPLVSQAYGLVQSINNELDPFLVLDLAYNSSDFSAVNEVGTGPNGIVVLPSGAMYLLSMSPESGGLVEVMSPDKAAHRSGSPITRHRSGKFWASYSGVGGTVETVDVSGRHKFQLRPKRAGVVSVSYLRQPADVEYVFTQNGRVITYDEPNSSHLEWGQDAAQRIIERAISYLSGHLDADREQVYHEQKAVSGQ